MQTQPDTVAEAFAAIRSTGNLPQGRHQDKSSLPTTIAEAFATWTALIAAEDAAGSDEASDPFSIERFRIEWAAVTLPAVTARDVWMLIAMTTDKPSPDDVKLYTADRVLDRAFREVGAD